MRCIWLTGLPCSGKSTIAKELEKHFYPCRWIDGDEIRYSVLSRGLGFSKEDRDLNLMRVSLVARMLVESGVTVICSFVSPHSETRDAIKNQFKPGEFFEVHVDASNEKCAERDVKGMWKKALAGEIKQFTGVSDVYEVPTNPDVYVNTESSTVGECVDKILGVVRPDNERSCLFIGRWNGVFHKGHEAIIRSKLDQGKSVIMAVRDVKPDGSNPWTAVQVKEMLEYIWIGEKVKVIVIPDIESVEYGRGVGYEVNEIKVEPGIASISGTEIRKMINEGNDEWKERVPERMVSFLLGRLKQ